MAGIEKIAASEGLQVLGWREVPVDNSMIGQQAADVEPSFRQLFLAAADGHAPLADVALDRKCFVVRKRIEHEVGDGRRGRLLPEPVGPHPRLQGDAHLVPGGRVLPRPGRRAGRVRPGPRALPLLHQHVPVVAPGPPLPLHGPQRRDQHGHGQRELDAGPRGPAGDRPHRRARAGVPHLHAGRLRHRPLRRGARAAPPRRLLAPPRRAHDDPGGVGEPRVDAGLEARLLPVPRLADGAVGRPGVDRLHRRHGDRRRARPQRPAPVALLGDRRRPRGHGVGGRRARPSTGHRRAEGPPPAGAHVPGRHQPRAASSATTRSRRPWPPSSPTASGSTPASCTSTTCRRATSSPRSTRRW